MHSIFGATKLIPWLRLMISVFVFWSLRVEVPSCQRNYICHSCCVVCLSYGGREEDPAVYGWNPERGMECSNDFASRGKFYKLHRSWGQPAVPIHLCCSTEEGTWRTPLPLKNLVAVPPRLKVPCMLVTRPCRMPNAVLRRHITHWQVLIGVR